MKAVNLLPSEQRGSAKTTAAIVKPEKGTPPFAAFVVLGLLAFAVAAVALSALASNTVKERRTELARVSADASAVKAQASSLQTYADFEGVATQRLSTVRGLAVARFDWERTLADLSRAMPDDVHLRTLDGTTAAGSGSGLRSSVSAPAIQLVGCTASQTSVARLMSRLRNVRGVTRVALAQSQETASAVAPASPGAARPASLCPKGSPPDFDVTMFFERAALPAGATVNAATAAATGATTATTPAAAATPAATASSATPATPAGSTAAAPTTATPTSTQGTSTK
jgi:Tfp pilus assembly protein PilN